MTLLSRLPIDARAARDFTAFLWRNLPGSEIGGAGLPAGAAARLTLASVAAWEVSVVPPGGGRLHVPAFAASPPAPDAPQDPGGRRNHDQIAFWQALTDGRLTPPPSLFVLLGDANFGAADGGGQHAAIRALLADPHLQDSAPDRTGGFEAALAPPNARHKGPPGPPPRFCDKPGSPAP